jgi:hypothetical protein
MKTSPMAALSLPGLDPFLFAEVGVEANGMALSVLSLFARQGCDPWQEAARLADLPRAQAAERLARLISRAPDRACRVEEVTTTTERLVALLPSRSARSIGEGVGASGYLKLLTPFNIALACLAVATAFLLAM